MVMLKTKIKICGMDSLDTALFCAKNAVDYLGLHFFPDFDANKKVCKIKLYKEIREKLPNVKLVLVVRTKYPEENIKNEIDEIFSVCKEVKVDYLQLNRGGGKTSADHVEEFRGMFKKADLKIGIIAVLNRNEFIIDDVKAVAKVADHLLFESGSRGGSGKTAPDDKLLEIPKCIRDKLFYAGGLDASNVADVIHKIEPFAVDVQPSLESPKGVKNQNLMTEFIDVVRNVSENGFNISWRTVEKENLVSKLKFLTLLEDKNNFKPEKIRFEERIQKTLNSLPKHYHTAALAVLSNVIYITEQMLADARRNLWYQYTHDFKHKDRIGLHLSNVHIFEFDYGGLRDMFFQDVVMYGSDYCMGAGGRRDDTTPFEDVDALLDCLYNLDNTSCLSEQALFDLLCLDGKKHWILLVDLSLSGGSVCSEIKRLKLIADHILKVEDLDISIFIQAITEEAQTRIEKLLAELNGSGANMDYYYAIKIPYGCAFNAKKKDKEYELLKNKELIEKIDELCSFFAEEYIIDSNAKLDRIVKKKRDEGKNKEACDEAKYGCGGLGWNVVVHRNVPDNSLPFLWWESSPDYKAPYNRLESKVDQQERPFVKHWIKRLGLDGGSNCPNLQEYEKIHNKYVVALDKHPKINVEHKNSHIRFDSVKQDVVSGKNRLDSVNKNAVIKGMVNDREKVHIIPCINFEERSIAFTEEIIKVFLDEGLGNNLAISPWTLQSRTNAWNLMEERKKPFIEKISQLGLEVPAPMEIRRGDTGTVDLSLIDRLIEKHQNRDYNLIIDLSTVPHDICYEISKKIAKDEKSCVTNYKKVYIVHTSAKEYLARKGLGPTHVGNIKLPLLPLEKEDENKEKHVAMIFPGREGYEAALAISALKNRKAEITVAINLFEPDVLSAFETCYANQLVCSGNIEGVSICYYYSQQDLQRVLAEFREHANAVQATHVDFAIFDTNWTIFGAAFEATKLEDGHKNVFPIIFDDTNDRNTHQCHNFYSKGIGLTNMFLVSKKSIEAIQKEMTEKREKIMQFFKECDVVVIDADDTIWHDHKYYSDYKEYVFDIIKREKIGSDNIFTKADLNVRLESFLDSLKGDTIRGEPVYVKAMNQLCNSLQLSEKGLTEVEEASKI
ncbi:MAG: phosphoribosylanthranilate isomerase, partial [Nitrososphaerota archaeon]|nr:phosphoribosylanthranilate isomerase [Nitrososphaerota archaeon]